MYYLEMIDQWHTHRKIKLSYGGNGSETGCRCNTLQTYRHVGVAVLFGIGGWITPAALLGGASAIWSEECEEKKKSASGYYRTVL